MLRMPPPSPLDLMRVLSACNTAPLDSQECSQLLATRMVEHGGSASSILMRMLDAAAAQPAAVPSLAKLVQVSRCLLLRVADVLPRCRSFDTSFQSLFYNAFCASCINCEQLLQQAQAALASVKPLQRPIFSQKAISNGSLHAMLELCGRPQLLEGSPALIATACVAGMLMYSQAVITGSAAAASDAVQILKSLAPLHAAALSLHPAAEAAAKLIVMRAEADVQATQPLLMQVADNVFAAARLFADSVGLHVNGICLRLLQFSSGVDDALRSIVVEISAAVYRSNCAAPPSHPGPALPPRATNLHDPRHLLPPRWCHCAAPQGHDIRFAALYTCVPSA
jgi:hypothetical protein